MTNFAEAGVDDRRSASLRDALCEESAERIVDSDLDGEVLEPRLTLRAAARVMDVSLVPRAMTATGAEAASNGGASARRLRWAPGAVPAPSVPLSSLVASSARLVACDLTGHADVAMGVLGLLGWDDLRRVAERLWAMFMLAPVPGRRRAAV